MKLWNRLWPLPPCDKQQKVERVIESASECTNTTDAVIPPTLVMRLIGERSIDGYILLKGVLYHEVSLDLPSISSHSSLPIYSCLQMGRQGNSYLSFYDRVSSEHIPTTETDIQSPPDWVRDLGMVHSGISFMLRLQDDIPRLRVATGEREVKYITSRGMFYPLISLLTTNSWIEGGWQGPAIVLDPDPESRYGSRAVGIIPDSLEITTVPQLYELILEAIPFLEKMDRSMCSSVEDFYSEHEALIGFFEENHIEYLEPGLGH